MKNIYILALLLISSLSFAQTLEEKEAKKKQVETEKASLAKPYHEEENADSKIKELIAKAKSENKNIILQVGGNWCIWCLRLNNFIQNSTELKATIDANYLYYHLNWSPKNKNEKFFAKYGNPGDKQGYPIFMVLNKKGKLIHVQETGSLEEGKSYSSEKVKTFLETWKVKS